MDNVTGPNPVESDDQLQEATIRLTVKLRRTIITSRAKADEDAEAIRDDVWNALELLGLDVDIEEDSIIYDGW